MNTSSPLRLVLFEPRIPQNTGNIARTCAALKLSLELIEPLGFSLEDRYLKRAGLDYWPLVNLIVHENLSSFLKTIGPRNRLISTSKSGGSCFKEMNFKHGDILLFGREDSGINTEIRNKSDSVISIPMPGSVEKSNGLGVRSLNLSVAFALVTYQACFDLKLC